MMWTVFLIMLPFYMRISTVFGTENVKGLRAEGISLPSNPEEWCPDGFPSWLTMVIPDWKGRNRTQEPPQTVRYYRNFLNPAFCPVVALLLWLLNTGLIEHIGGTTDLASGEAPPSVFLFPRFSVGFTGLLPYQRHNVDKLRAWFNLVFEAVGLPDCVPHSIRSTGLIWSARCYAQEWQARVTGRWTPKSTTYMDYLQEGYIMRDDFIARSAIDPIWKFWVWKFGVVNVRAGGERVRRQRVQ